MKLFVAGSRKFFDEIEGFVSKCEAAGIEAYTADKPRGDSTFAAEEEALKRAYERINDSDAIYVVAKGGYVGMTVAIEMKHARDNNKPVIASEEIFVPVARTLVTSVLSADDMIKEYAKHV
jgi:hypothetical protein